ncbi:hypothetical protein [Algoriphagus terrigena]|uniref:hypothetical protein n=1 Tax=Algoriphagus terrigena TaxID=344884 RepID=UPI0003F7C9F2|nr:hypothetical protein [Algoriphagus terrigena]
MELEEMKSRWQDLSVKVERQERIQKDILLEMTKTRFKRKLDGIRLPELFGTLISLAYAAYLVFNFGKIDLWFNQIFAVANVLFFVILPLASLMAIRRMNALQINHLAMTEMVGEFQRAKRNFWRVQQAAVWLSGVIVLTLVPVLGDIQDKMGRFLEAEFWMIYIPLALAFLFFFSRYVLGKYRRIINQSEDILREV